MIFKKSEIPFRHSLPSTRIIVLGAGALVLAGCSGLIGWAAGKVAEVEYLTFVAPVAHLFVRCMLICLAIAVLAVIAGIVIYILTPERWKIAVKVKKALLTYEYGNPLGLQEGQRMPRIRCKDKWEGCYVVIVSAVSCTVEQLAKVSTCISSALNRKHSIYAVTQTDVDVACNNVRYLVENVAVDKSLHVQSVTDLKKEEPMKLIVQEGTYIDLSTSGHMLVAGKTRSGKTTGIISLLLQVLQDGRDKHGSEVMIIDPKQAELSQLPHTYTLDEDGEARAILDAMRHFADVMKQRQKILNNRSRYRGNADKWWKTGLKPCFLFIDEYVALRTIFPKSAGKDKSDYSLNEFENVLRRIITMGASAGCFVIISIAEASVQEGGLPAMLRSACSTKVLFRPTLPEGRLMWDSEKLKDFPERVYGPGDAWFSSTDGIHDNVTFVHFPYLEFPEYGELGRLLEEYYRET